MDDTARYKELKEYCGPDNFLLHKISKGLEVGGIVLLLIILFTVIISVVDPPSAFVLSIVPTIYIILGIKISYDSPANKTIRKLRKYRKLGILDELAEDFKLSEPKYDDALRLGEKGIFGNGEGEFAPLDMVVRLGRVQHDHYQDGRLRKTERFIEVHYKHNEKKLCNLTQDHLNNFIKWSSFAEDIRCRRKDITIIESIDYRETRTHSSDGD